MRGRIRLNKMALTPVTIIKIFVIFKYIMVLIIIIVSTK